MTDASYLTTDYKSRDKTAQSLFIFQLGGAAVLHRFYFHVAIVQIIMQIRKKISKVINLFLDLSTHNKKINREFLYHFTLIISK